MDEILTNQEEPQEAPLLIKIDLGAENFANIAAYRNASPLDLATKFCQEY